MMTRGRGGVWIPPKSDDVIYEQPLIAHLHKVEERRLKVEVAEVDHQLTRVLCVQHFFVTLKI